MTERAERVIYEFPLNERVRSLLRLEFLFRQLEHAAAGDSEWDARFALQSLIQLQELAARKELRGELGRELHRQGDALARHQSRPGVDPQALTATLREVEACLHELRAPDNNPGTGAAVANDELLGTLRQRLAIPGGSCQFDLPALHYWLQQSPRERAAQLSDWQQPLRPVGRSVMLILSLLRASTGAHRETAVAGFFQHQPENPPQAQLVRVTISAELKLFAEFSGNHHRYSVRFSAPPEQPSATPQRSQQTRRDVSFWLSCCVL